MTFLIRAWLDKLEEVEQAKQAAEEAERRANMADIPNKLRPAEAKDIVEGAVIWYPEDRDISDEKYPYGGWHLVCETLHYGDDWKAYTDHEGSRHGLRGAFVEIHDQSENIRHPVTNNEL